MFRVLDSSNSDNLLAIQLLLLAIQLLAADDDKTVQFLRIFRGNWFRVLSSGANRNSSDLLGFWLSLSSVLFQHKCVMFRTCLPFNFMFLFQMTLSAVETSNHFLHPLFSDHTILQRDAAVPIWGWTKPKAKVTVNFSGQSKSTIAEADGRWTVNLKPMRASDEPRKLTVSSTTGQTLTINDVLVGDVWLCSGQSNMEMGIGLCNASNDVATANFPNIRLLTVPKRALAVPAETLQCAWLRCSPETVSQGGWGGFSATAFFFGRELHRELKIPIGLLHSSWGGTVAEAWTSHGALTALDDFTNALAWIHRLALTNDDSKYVEAYDDWFQKKDVGTQKGWNHLETPNAGWQNVSGALTFEQNGLGKFDGVVWFRREFAVSENWIGKNLQLQLGRIDDYDTTYVNGAKIGQTHRVEQPRSYAIPAALLKPGKNVLTVRVLDTGGDGGLMEREPRITPKDDLQVEPQSLAKGWQIRTSTTLRELSLPLLAPNSSNPNVPTFLYNGMISPLLPFAIKGAIWYQGENNTGRAIQYRRLLPTMIEDWRARFGMGNFPFYIVQIAAFRPGAAEPRDDAWSELREAQAFTARDVANSGLAVTIDVGDAHDVHPKDKHSVGHRLALNALAQTYGRKIDFSGPWYRSMKRTSKGIRLEFNHVGGGLIAKDGPLSGFAIAGADQKFVWANAAIDGKSVIVSSSSVPNPVAVRYAWDSTPKCNLYNAAGLPAVPFRTDKWPGTEARE